MIDPRQQTDGALHEQWEWLRVTFASIADAIITTDIEGRVTFLNRVAESLTGWTLQVAKGQPLDSVFHIMHEESRQPVESPTARALRDGVVVRLANHTLLIAQDGTERPIDASAAPIRNEQGEVAGGVLVFRDVTERKRLEDELRKRAGQLAGSEQRLAGVVNNVVDGIISIDERGMVETFNPAAERLFGYRAEEVIGHNVSMLMIEPYCSEHDGYIANYLRSGEAKIIGRTGRVLPGRRKDGSMFQMDLAVAKFSLDKHHHFVGIVRDMTDRNRAAELATTDRMKDEFLATLAHELRNPLAPLRNAVQVLRLRGGDQAGQTLYEMMERQVGLMVRLVDDLLDVSSINRGKIDLKWEWVELASVVNTAVEMCRPLAEHAKHEVIVTLPPESIYLHADSVRLAEVFANLLNNSCKYTEPGGKIWLHAERQDSDMVVRVKDTGVGIAPDKLASVFEMFTQIERSLERSQGGLGIGLTLVKRLVEMHGGSVEVRSEGSGKGCEFVVRLPLIVDSPKAHKRLGLTRKPQLAGHRILVVDDNRDSAESLALLLKISGNETHTAFDGLEAVEAGASFKPDVILMDIGLPKLNGYEACRRIREQPWGKNIILVALTGWGQEEDRRKSKEVGFDAHLVKPVDLAALIKLLAESQLKHSTETDKPIGPSLRVLVVDDSRDVTHSFSVLLQRYGHDVQTAADGITAMQKAIDYQPDVVILDIGLPGMNGLEVAKRLREQPMLKNAVLVALTGYSQEADRQRSQEAGFDHHLVKPVDIREVLEILTTVKPT